MLYPRAYDQQGRGTETSKEDCGPHQEETASPSHRAEAYIDDGCDAELAQLSEHRSDRVSVRKMANAVAGSARPIMEASHHPPEANAQAPRAEPMAPPVKKIAMNKPLSRLRKSAPSS